VAAVPPYGKSAYRDLMREAQMAGWTFGSFVDPEAVGARTIYLRHDVDYSLELAVELAELNNELGISGTFFVQLRAQFYNPFERTETARLLRLRALGQEVALHYVIDPDAGPTPEALGREFELLRKLVPDAVRAFSWHQPTQAALQTTDLEGAGLVNAYSERFFRQMTYLSDSTHRASVEVLRAELGAVNGTELQLLLHPVNWIAGGSSGVEILVRGWVRVLRDHERTLLQNRTYTELFPEGMPTAVLDSLEEKLLAATLRRRES
jgi:ribosomal protein L30/L7E